MKNAIWLLIAATGILLPSCKKNSETFNKNILSSLTIEFDNIAGEQDLELNTGVYTNAAGEQFSVTKLQYFISQIQLQNSSGQTYSIPQDSSYFLIRESEEESHEVHLNVPEAEYTKITFSVGVNDTPEHIHGDLLPSPDTYWSQDSGYVFFNFEGSSAAAPQVNGERVFKYHIGGKTTSTVNNIKTVTLDLSTRGAAKVLSGHSPEVHLMADVLKIFTGTSDISIATHPFVEYNDSGADIAGNYQNMFRHDHTHNN